MAKKIDLPEQLGDKRDKRSLDTFLSISYVRVNYGESRLWLAEVCRCPGTLWDTDRVLFFIPHPQHSFSLTTSSRYRTLSIRVDEKVASDAKAKKSADPADAIAAIDVHLIHTDQVYVRYSCSPTVGLEPAAVERRLKDGKNIISPPPTQYWLKALNYIFGGFNFLMWIAFVVTIVGPPHPYPLLFPSIMKDFLALLQAFGGPPGSFQPWRRCSPRKCYP